LANQSSTIEIQTTPNGLAPDASKEEISEVKLLREPLLHFIFIGAVIYLLYGLFAEQTQKADDKTIVISAGEIESMQAFWQKRWNRPPTEDELEGLIEKHIRETVLYREGLAMGLNQHDVVIRRRLAQKVEYLAKNLVALTPPTEQELQAYFAEHQQRYQEPALYTFTQVYINPDKRGDATLDDAEKIKATLIAQGDAIENARALGDDLKLEAYYRENDSLEIQRNFGNGFTKLLLEMSPGKWHGPILSGYGAHLVYVSQVIEQPAPAFEDVRESVAEDWRTEKKAELNEKFYEDLRELYTIVIESPTGDDKLALSGEETQ
jgi:hypothetical protein